MGDQMSGDHMCLGPNVSQPSSTNLLLFSKLITSSVWSIKKKTHRHSEQNLWNSIPWTTQNLGAPDFWHWPLGTMYLRYFRSGTLWVLIKSHVKAVWRPQNLPKDWRSWGRFCRSPNSLRMGFTFLMDANTSKYSKYFYNYFMGMKQTLISHWKILKKSMEWEISFTFSWYLKISLFTFTS